MSRRPRWVAAFIALVPAVAMPVLSAMSTMTLMTAMTVVACSDGAKPNPSASTSSSVTRAAPKPPTYAEPVVSSSASVVKPIEVGPPPSNASKEEHERAAIALLGGEVATDAVEEEGTKKNKELNPDAYRALSTNSPSVRVTLKPMTLSGKGKLAEDEVLRVVRQHIGRFRMCYENALKTTPDLEGTITLAFTISEKGESMDEKVQSDPGFKDTPLPGCIQRSIHGLKLPEPQAGQVMVSLPLLFTAIIP